MWFFVCWVLIGVVGIIGFGFAVNSQAHKEYGEKGVAADAEGTSEDWDAIHDASMAYGYKFLISWFVGVCVVIITWPVSLAALWIIEMKRIRSKVENNE